MSQKYFVVLGFLVTVGLSLKAQANFSTESLLIDKLTQVFLKLPEGDATKTKLTLRLADLHAERGRLQAKEELEKGCLECHNGLVDRKKALEYYQYVLDKLQGDAKQNVLVQIGHIYEVLGENQKAIDFYQKVIAGTGEGKTSEAQFSLGEIYFKQKNYPAAEKHYRQTLQDASFARKGLAAFRLAWCRYNVGDVPGAVSGLEEILKNPKMLSPTNDGTANVDTDFKSEVAKDYTIFMAHSSQIGPDAIQKVRELSPEASRIENLSFLAKELERLGQISQAVAAWELVIAETSDPQIRMEGLVYLGGLQLKSETKSKILPYLKRAFSQWGSLSQCKVESQCEELRKRVRALVFDWNRTEKETPSPELIEAYQAYLVVAPKDREALELGAHAAMLSKNDFLSYEWIQSAYKGLDKKAEKKEIQEKLLLKRIEIAEASKNAVWLADSQTHYLKNSPTKTRVPEIRYQMAQKFYEDKNFQHAADQFKALAMESGTVTKLRVQAAEMALDSLVLEKKDSLIENWANEFAQIFPDQRKRFRGLASQSVLTQTASLSTGAAGDVAAWQTLNRFDIASADADQKKTFYKNKTILARKLKKFPEMEEALRSLLDLNLNREETQFALENKVWLSEIQLNFNDAFESYKKLNNNQWLELARLADLAEKPAETYYFNYLKNPDSRDIAIAVCLKLVREAKGLKPQHKQCLPYLNEDKNMFASVLLESLSTDQSPQQIAKVFKTYNLDGTPAALVLNRSVLIIEGENNLKKLKNHKLDGRSEHVGASLKSRMNAITGLEKTIVKATEIQDWLSQTLLLTELKSEYLRFYNELLVLPTPTGLSAQEQQEYLSLLSQQAAPYKEKADQIQFKVDELWKNDAAIEQIYTDFHKSSMELQALLGPQIEMIRSKAVNNPAFLELVYRKAAKNAIPSFALLESARQQVKAAPMSKEALQKLIQFETARGYQPMIIYLNSRLKMVEDGFETKDKAI